MPTFVAFLRAVNVGSRRYPMAKLRAVLAAAGFTDVETHIQTGNVRVRTTLRSPARVAAVMEGAMLADRGFEVPVVVLTPAELRAVHEEALEYGEGLDLAGHYLTLPVSPPDPVAAAALEALSVDGEQVRVGIARGARAAAQPPLPRDGAGERPGGASPGAGDHP